MPKDVPIASVYELTTFSVVFLFCGFLFFKCNEVPVVENSIQVECLNNMEHVLVDTAYFYPYAEIDIRFPMTNHKGLNKAEYMKDTLYYDENQYSDNHIYIRLFNGQAPQNLLGTIYNEEDLLDHKIRLSIEKDSFCLEQLMRLDSFMISNDSYMSLNNKQKFTRKNHLLDSITKSIKNGNYDDYTLYNITEESSFPYNRGFRRYKTFKGSKFDCDTLEKMFDSLYNAFSLKYSFDLPLYYIETKMDARRFLALKRAVAFDGMQKHNNKWYCDSSMYIRNKGIKLGGCELVNYTYNDKSLGIRLFELGADNFSKRWSEKEIITQGTPGWTSLEDISQAYYKFKLKAETLDSIVLHIDFVGATEFSLMHPEPDKKTLSGVYFYDKEKIKQICSDGLFFHAKFVELQNRQTIRMFFLTAIMGGLTTVFIGFFVLAIYKILLRRFVK